MSSIWCRWFGWGCPKPRPRPVVGVVCHRLNTGDVAALRAMGVQCVRLSLYQNGDGAQWIDAALAAAFTVLAVTYRLPAERIMDARRWPTVLWQVGNEPDWRVSDAAAVARGATDGAVSPGLAHGTPAAWIAAYSAAARTGQVLALHAYGIPLAAAIAETVAKRPQFRRLWLTEIGVQNDAAALTAALRAIDASVVERVYVYALWSEGDSYTLTAAQQAAVATFIRGG